MPFEIKDGVLTKYQNLTGETEVVIPEGVKKIGDSAFNECGAMRTVKFPEGLQEIENYAFWGCGLTSVTLPEGLQRIGSSVFDGCFILTSVTIPDSVTEIGGQAFSSCYSLQSVKLPKGLTVIPSQMFSSCKSLQTIEIPDSVTEIGKYAFANCEELTDVKLPAGLQKLDETAFLYCFKMMELPLTVIDGQLLTTPIHIGWEAMKSVVPRLRNREFDYVNEILLVHLCKNGYDCDAIRAYLRDHFDQAMDFLMCSIKDTTFFRTALSLDIAPSREAVEKLLQRAQYIQLQVPAAEEPVAILQEYLETH